jgi:hypothetical protein
MVVDAAGALQQSIGRPLVVSESAQWPYGATSAFLRIQRPTEFCRVAGFAMSFRSSMVHSSIMASYHGLSITSPLFATGISISPCPRIITMKSYIGL